MRLGGRRRSKNIEDRRGQGGFGRSGPTRRIRLPRGGRSMRTTGGGLGGIIMLVVLFFVLRAFDIDPMQVLGDVASNGDPFGQTVQQTRQQSPASAPRDDARTIFVSRVLAETEDVWDGIFRANGSQYPQPTLVLFTDRVRSACGLASFASGPFYCPGDNKLYLDLGFFDELERRFGAGGDFAQAYVIAHEVGHHVQNIIGVLPRFNQMRRSMSKAEENAMSVRVELQADCFAGIWGHYAEEKGLLSVGDLEEALNAASQIGDDTIQRRTQGYVVPESFSHGTSAQRRNWFSRGFENGRLEDCDTFNEPV